MNSLYSDLKTNANNLQTYASPTQDALTLTLDTVVPYLNTFRWLVSSGVFTSNKNSCRREGNWHDDKNKIRHIAFKDTYTMNKGSIVFVQEFVDDFFIIKGSSYFTTFDLDEKWTCSIQKHLDVKIDYKSLWFYNREKNMISWKGLYIKDFTQNHRNKLAGIDMFVWRRISKSYDINSGTFISNASFIS